MNMRRMTMAMAGLLLILSACSSDGGDATTAPGSGGATTTAAPDDGATTTAAPDDVTTTGGGDAAGVGVSTSALGDILVDPDGFTLYVLTNDTAGESTCDAGCSSTWPAVDAETPIGPDLDAALFGSTETGQLTINDQPLYRFAPDANPGDTGGQGAGGVWFVVGPDGSLIEG